MIERARIRKFSQAVARQFRPEKIILFGSHAYGQPLKDSDVDLLVIMPKVREHGERMSVRIRLAIPLDLIVRSRREVAKRLRWGDSFLKEIMEKGEVLYESDHP